MSSPLADFAAEMKRQRLRRGWSQERLALEAGLTQPHICRLENGTRGEFGIAFLSGIAETLGMKLTIRLEEK